MFFYATQSLIISMVFFSCSKDDSENLCPEGEFQTVINLHAPVTGGQGEPSSGDFTKFNFSSGQITESETQWDIGLRGTTIIVNGGETTGIIDEPERNGDAAAYIENNSFWCVQNIDNDLFLQDSMSNLAIPTGSGNGWYNYTGAPNHLILPIPGRILIFKTHDSQYVKVEILSYYFDIPINPDSVLDQSRYYSFNYSYL
jgi:hypothetical protein